MQKKCFVDTNCLMQYSQEIFNLYDRVYICGYVLQELDKHKMSSNEEKKYLARVADRTIETNRNKITYLINECKFNLPSYFDIGSMDNKIISVLNQLYDSDNEVVALSNDLLFREKCHLLMIPCEKFDGGKDEELSYKGYKDVILSDYDLASYYKNKRNDYGLLNNEYLIIRDSNGKIVEKLRWTDENGFIPLFFAQQSKNTYKFNNKGSFSNTIKPRNVQQEIAFDLFQDKNITCKIIFGKHGSGKDLIMSYHALQMIESGVYDKLIFVRNNFEVKNSKPLGFLPGDERSKLLPYAMPLADHLGGIDGLNQLIDDKKIELQHFGFVRGRDIKKSLIYVTEAENMTKEHIQLLIGRLAEGSALWLNGDFKQIDDSLFERNSGLKQTINRLKGQELFGCVELNITERSKTAQLADLLD